MHECSVARLCLIWDSMDYRPPSFSVNGFPRQKTLECTAISFCRGSSPPWNTHASCIDSSFFNVEPSGNMYYSIPIQNKSDILLVIITIGSNYMINTDKSDSVLWLNVFMLYNLPFISSSRYLPNFRMKEEWNTVLHFYF